MSQEYGVGLYLWGSGGGSGDSGLLSHQLTRLMDFAFEKGWEIVDAYIDYESMADCERPELARLVEGVHLGKIDVILTMSLERILRGTDFALALREELLSAEVHLVTLDGMIDTLAGDVALIGLYDWVYRLADLRMV